MLTITLPYPPSVNRYWRQWQGRTLISAAGRAYRTEAMRAALQVRKTAYDTSRLRVTIEATMPDRRKRDLDNLPKAVLDALTHAGVWADDEQIDELTIRRAGVAKPGHVVVVVERAA